MDLPIFVGDNLTVPSSDLDGLFSELLDKFFDLFAPLVHDLVEFEVFDL